MPTKIITVRRTGDIQFVHDDRLAGLFTQGQAKITRASHVEPGDPARGQDPLKWYADMGPSGGGTLGPFDERGQALTAEVDWINRHVLTELEHQRLKALGYSFHVTRDGSEANDESHPNPEHLKLARKLMAVQHQQEKA